MADYSEYPLRAQDAPALAPLQNSVDARQIEADLKAAFLQVFEQMVRPGMQDTRTLGIPHLGGPDQFERAAKQEGLSIYRDATATDDASLRYMLEAWRARNPKRGLAMLQAYLQLMWPNKWRCHQLWQAKEKPYPLVLSEVDGGHHYLTSRVRVEISARALGNITVEQIAPALRSVVPARVVLEIAAVMQFRIDAPVALACSRGFQFQEFRGTAEPSRSGFAKRINMGAGFANVATFVEFRGAAEPGPQRVQ